MNMPNTLQTSAFAIALLVSPGFSLVEAAAQAPPADPGVRGGSPAAGGPVAGLNDPETSYFNAAQARFVEIDSVQGGIAGQPGNGLGPRFNLNSCGGVGTGGGRSGPDVTDFVQCLGFAGLGARHRRAFQYQRQ
jgi:hypothetical protein